MATKIENLDDLKNIDGGILMIHNGASPEANYALYGTLKDMDSDLITLWNTLSLYKDGTVKGRLTSSKKVSGIDFSNPDAVMAFLKRSEFERREKATYSLKRMDHWQIYVE